jgi:hypothetical protein
MVLQHAIRDEDMRADPVTWFASATRAPSVLIAMICVGLLAGLMRGQTASVPSLTQGSLAPVPVVAVLSLAASVAMFWGWSGLAWSSMAAAGRSPAGLLLLMYLLAPITLGLASYAFGGQGAVAENLRNAFGLAGLAVLGSSTFRGAGAIAVPIAYLLVAFMAGRPSGGRDPYVWAWILHDGGSVTALALSACLAALGAALVPSLPARFATDEAE